MLVKLVFFLIEWWMGRGRFPYFWMENNYSVCDIVFAYWSWTIMGIFSWKCTNQIYSVWFYSKTVIIWRLFSYSLFSSSNHNVFIMSQWVIFSLLTEQIQINLLYTLHWRQYYKHTVILQNLYTSYHSMWLYHLCSSFMTLANYSFINNLGNKLMLWQVQAWFLMDFHPHLTWTESFLALIIIDDGFISQELIRLSKWLVLWKLGSVRLRHNIYSLLDPSMIVSPFWHDRIVQLKEPCTFIFNLQTLILNAWGEWETPSPPPGSAPLGEGKRGD